MPLLAPKVRFEHRVEWSIRNFHLCPSWDDLVITSPEFEIRLLDVVTMKFSLQTQGPGNSMLFAVHLEGSGDAVDEQGLSLILEVAIPGAEKLSTNKPNSSTLKKRPLIPKAVTFFLLDGVYPSMPLIGETLVLPVTIKTTAEQCHYWSTLLDPHLLALSENLVSMVSRPLYTDCYVESDKGTRLDANYCILRVRMPVLFQAGETSNPSSDAGFSDSEGQPMEVDRRIFGTGMSTEASRTLIFYLYGRLASSIPKNQRMKLLSFAQEYKLKDLESMLKPYPSGYLLETCLVVEDMCFNIIVADLWENKIRKTSFSRNIKTAVSWTITPDQSIVFTFLLDSDHPQVPINMKFTIFLKNRSDQVIKEHVIWHTFPNDGAWTTPPFGFADVHSISCRVQMTEGRWHHKIEQTMEDAKGSLVVFNNLRNLSEQIEKLYVDQVGCDLELHVGSTVFHVHKAIVVARSPMIRKMVKKREKEPMDPRVVMIKMREFPPEYYNDVIIYMYSGRIEPKSTNYMYAVAEVADYLDMPFLMDLCYFLEQ